MKRFFSYLLLGLLGTAAGIPYILSLLGSSLKSAPFPLPVIVLLILIQTTVILAIATFFGLRAARATGLSTDLIEHNQTKSKAIAISIALGILAAALITIGDHAFGRFLPNLTIESVKIDTWKLLIVPFYGGIVEELLMRLFFVSLFVWILAKIRHVTEPVNHAGLVWASIILAAILFGLGHLPATAALTLITPLVVVRAIVLNGLGGLIFGWLYWKKGLPSAMISHATADLSMFVVIPFWIHLIS
jgi:membrane protease YdiL (CAAX protease family)